MEYEEIDSDVLAQQAYDEMDGKVEPEKKPEEEPVEPPKEEPTEPEAEPSPEEEPSEEESSEEEPSEEEKAAEEKRILEAEDETLNEEELAKKAELKAAQEEDPGEEPSEEDVVREYALKHNLTLVEAQEDIDKTKAIVEKYKGDPAELARALRHTQSGYDQLKAKESKPEVIVKQDPSVEIREYAQNNSEKIINNFRSKYPAKSETMSDEAILEDTIAQAERDYEIWAKTESEKITRTAAEKRDQLLVSIGEADKQFLPDVKALLLRTPDNQVAHESFDIKDLICYARGNYYSPDKIKAIEDAAFKRGKENPKILGVKTPSSGGPAPAKSKDTVTGLNEDQKDRALEMFPAEDGYSAEDAYKEFQDTFKNELKKDKNYL